MSLRLRAAQRQLDRALAALRYTDPEAFAEHMASASAVLERAEGRPARLPRGVALVERNDCGQRTFALQSKAAPSLALAGAFSDPALAIELAWSELAARRPWAIDDARLHAIVDHPPISHAAILGSLLCIRFADWICQALVTMTALCVDEPRIEHAAGVLDDLLAANAYEHERYEARATLAVVELSGLFDVEEPCSSLEHEIGRWRWMLHDYALALDGQLHERLEALAPEGRPPAPVGMADAWRDVIELRQLDACVGLLLARAAMLDAKARPSLVGYVDPMSTRAVGSFAWWCRRMLHVLELERPLGERLRSGEIEPFVVAAHHMLRGLDPGLSSALLRVFPSLVSCA